MKAMFEPSWPKDIPSSCPCCGNELRTSINLRVGPGRAARIVKWIAHVMILPCILLGVPLFVFCGMPNGGLAGGYAILGFMFLPPVVMAVIGRMLPSSRRVNCQCGYEKDYPAFASRKTEDQRIVTPNA
jgi:hypothetical protein